MFSRYLLGIDPTPELVRRYARAAEALFPRPASAEDAALIDLALRRPALLPLLDAAAGVLRPSNRLRRKLVVLSAILETDPLHFDRFEATASAPILVLARSALIGLAASFKFLLGLPFYLFASRRR